MTTAFGDDAGQPPIRFGRVGRVGRPTVAALLTYALLCGGCATSSPTEEALSPSEVTTAPELQGCPAYTEPNRSGTGVRLSFVVKREGWVDPSTIEVRSHRDRISGAPLSRELVERAVSDAESCRFTPGRLEGRPVRVRMSKRFTYPSG